MILMPQIFDVTTNEIARYKRNELELWFSDKDVDVAPQSVTRGSIYKITRLKKVHYFFIWSLCGRKLLNNWINFKEQMHQTLIVQNEETWTLRHFRSHTDCVPPLFSIEMKNPF